MDERSRVLQIAVLLAFYLFLATVLPAVDDEVYYWCWSKDVQWSYYDHPPMTAVLIRLSTRIFGDSVFAFRVPACIAAAFAIYVISRLTPFKPLVLGVVLTPLFTIFAVLITPDAPLIMFWAAYLWWLVELHQRLTPANHEPLLKQHRTELREGVVPTVTTGEQLDGSHATPISSDQTGAPAVSMRWWLVGGIILGCGVLSKYTMGLAVPAGLASLLLARRRWRDWLPGYIVHGIIAFVVASPILIYNIGQNFEPLLFQLRHSAQKSPSSLRSFGDFVGVNVLAFGTLPFFLFPWVCYHIRRLCENPRLRVCVCLYALPLAFFLYKSTQTRLEGNWALVCFISFWPLASEWNQSVRASRIWRWLTVAAFLPPILAVLGLTSHLISASPFVPQKIDRVYRQIALNAAANEVAQRIREYGESLPVYTDTYQSTARLRFQKLDARQIDGLTRPSHFTRPPRHLTDVSRAFFVCETPLPPNFCEGFPAPELLATVQVVYRGETDSTLRIWLYSKNN